MNLYTYCANNPLIYIDPSGNGYVWNNFGEVIGTCPGSDYTDCSREALDTHGGEQMMNTTWTGGWSSLYNSGSSGSNTSGSSSSGGASSSGGSYSSSWSSSSKSNIVAMPSAVLNYKPQTQTNPFSETVSYLPNYHYPGYSNINVTGNVGIGFTGGIMTDNTGDHFYIGLSFGYGANISRTTSRDTMSTGLNAGFGYTGIFSGSKSIDLSNYAHPTSTEKGFGAGFNLGGSVYWVFK